MVTACMLLLRSDGARPWCARVSRQDGGSAGRDGMLQGGMLQMLLCVMLQMCNRDVADV